MSAYDCHSDHGTQPTPTTQLEALIRLLIKEGHMTPEAERQILKLTR